MSNPTSEVNNFSIQNSQERKYCLCAALLIVEKGRKILEQFILHHWNYFPLSPYHPLSGRDIQNYEKIGPPLPNPLRLHSLQWKTLEDHDISRWDISLICAILQFSKAAQRAKNLLLQENHQFYQNIWSGINRLRELRNEEYGHISNFKMSFTVFQNLTNKFTAAISGMSYFITQDDINDINALINASLPDDQITARADQLEKDVNALIKSFSENRLLRLEKWINTFFVYADRSINDQLQQRNRVSEVGSNFVPQGPMRNSTTRSTFTSLRSATRTTRTDLGGSELVSGKLSIRIMPEDKTLPEMSSKTQLIVGSRSLMEWNYRLPSNQDLDGYNLTPLLEENIVGANRWILGLDKDEGLGFEEFSIYYDALLPGWVVEKLPIDTENVAASRILGSSENKIYIFNGPNDSDEYRRQVLEKPHDFCLLQVNDRIRFGRKHKGRKEVENHVLIMTTLTCDKNVQLPFEGLKAESITGHKIEGRSFTKNKHNFVLPMYRGGFSMIYKAYSEKDNLYYALKVPFHVKYFDHLRKEVQILTKIGGFRSVIFLRDMFPLQQNRLIQKKTVPVFKMDWAHLGSLHEAMITTRVLFDDQEMRNLMNDGQKLMKARIQRVTDILIQIAEAMEFAHSHDVTHADLKPANILVMNYRENNPLFFDIKVCDFNISSGQDLITADSFASWGCTRGFRAPEQSSQIVRRTNLPFLVGKCDVWSLGILIMQLISMNHWSLRDIEEICMQEMQEPNTVEVSVDSLSQRVERHFREEIVFHFDKTLVYSLRFSPLRELVLRTFQFQPAKRPSSSEVVQALRTFASESGFAVIHPPSPIDKRVVDNSRRLETKYVFKMSTVSLQEAFSEKYLSILTPSPEVPAYELFTVLLSFAEQVLLPALPVRLDQFLVITERLGRLIQGNGSFLRNEKIRHRYDRINAKERYYLNLLRSSLTELDTVSEKLELLALNAYRDLASEFKPVVKESFTPPLSLSEEQFSIYGPVFNQYSPGSAFTSKQIHSVATAILAATSYSPFCQAITFGIGSFTLRRGGAEKLVPSGTAEATFCLGGNPSAISEGFRARLYAHQNLIDDLLLVELETAFSMFCNGDTLDGNVCVAIVLAIEHGLAPIKLFNFLNSRLELQPVVAQFRSTDGKKKTIFHLILEMIAPPDVMRKLIHLMMKIYQNAGIDHAGLDLRDHFNRTPLLYACKASRSFVPPDIVKLIAQSYPDAIRIPYKRDRDGWWPLHQYLRTEGATDCSDEALNYLLEQFPESASMKEWTPKTSTQGEGKGYPLNLSVMHCGVSVVKRFYDIHPPAIYEFGGYEAQPLSFAIYTNHNYEVIDFLLSVYPKEVQDEIDFTKHRKGCAIYDLQGNLPLHTALKYEHGTVQIVSRFVQEFPEAVLWYNFENESVADLVEEYYKNHEEMMNIVLDAVEKCQDQDKDEIRREIRLINEEFRSQLKLKEALLL